MNTKVVLFWITFLGLMIRMSGASILQRGFDGDEAAFGYYGYSLSHNLSDEYGNKLPLYFPSIGDYKYPVYAYFTAIPVSILGLNEFSTRFVSIVSGAFLPIVIYFLAFAITKKKNIGIASALLAAISPYGIMFSSKAFESNLATTLVSLGILFVINYSKNKRPKVLIAASVMFFLAMLTYSSTRVFLMTFLPIMYVFVFRKVVKTKKVISLFIISIIVLGVFLSIDIRSRVRANDIMVFGKNQRAAEFTRNELLLEDSWVLTGNKLLLAEVIHSDFVIKSFDVLQNYFEHLSFEYMFLDGNPNMPKYSIPRVGQYYFFEVLTMFMGIVYLSTSKQNYKNIIYFWILVSLLPSSLTIETPNPVRALISLPAFIILSGCGLYHLYEIAKGKNWVRRRLVFLTMFLVIFSHFAYFWHQFSIHDVYHRPWYEDGGMKEMVSSVRQMSSYENVVIGGDPYIFFLFYNKVHPEEFVRKSVIVKENPGVWERVERYENIIFKMDVACPKIGKAHVLYVCRGNEIPQNAILHQVITFNDSVPAFLLLEFVPFSERITQDLPSTLHYMVQTDLSFNEALLPSESVRYW
ncbi:glycosyltransferase family 39 protein [Candidatus Woesebacteria bacterium]|nr:MAG: glycosyltransferase family 39 protein [Candidatus Woesebacteria bacterium]